MKKLLMGNEAIAYGAVAAGVNVVCGYPGTPSTEVLETVARLNEDKKIYVEWSVNEKVAMELAAGASYSGARVLVTMKQVGLNVASDPLMCVNYIGTNGGMVVLVCDDPGPFSSQTEQDTRHFAEYANIPVFDPSTPEEAYDMIKKAFDFSEKHHTPVFLRPTTRVCHATATIEAGEKPYENKISGFEKDPKWVIFPPLAYKRHNEIERNLNVYAEEFSSSPLNYIEGSGTTAIAAGGVGFGYAREVIEKNNLKVSLLKIGNPFPFPTALAEKLLDSTSRVLVVEELDPVIEDALLKMTDSSKIFGKNSGNLPFAGEYSYELIEAAILDFLGMEKKKTVLSTPPILPARPPVLCAGCPHRASFYAVKQATKGMDAIYTGDIGCYTLGNAAPLFMTDTCLCMGGGITVAQGLKRAEDGRKHIAFIGDSTFFHSGITGVVNAVYNKTDITVVVLDNSTTAMTGHQPHPGIGKTMMGIDNEQIDIYKVLEAIGVKKIAKANPLKLDAAIAAAKEAIAYEGVSAVIYKAPCIALVKPKATPAVTDCKACGKCVRELGCPAMSFNEDNTLKIDSTLCTGCGLCGAVCPFGCIGGNDNE